MTTTTNITTQSKMWEGETTIAEWECPECDYSVRLVASRDNSFRVLKSDYAYWWYFSPTTEAEARARFQQVFVDSHKH